MTTQDKTKESTVDESKIFAPSEVLGDWEPKPLTIAGSLQLTRIVGWALAQTALNLKDMGSVVDGQWQMQQIGRVEVMRLLQSFEPEVVQEMFSIILQKPPAWVEAHWKMAKAIQCFLSFWELEDMGELFLAAGRLASRATRTTGSAS